MNTENLCLQELSPQELMETNGGLVISTAAAFGILAGAAALGVGIGLLVSYTSSSQNTQQSLS